MIEDTWKCHACGKERPDNKISVLSAPLPIFLNATMNFRYCNDNFSCLKIAKKQCKLGTFDLKKENK